MVYFDNTVLFFDIMFDELRQIAIFTKVIEHGSFRGAAAELRLSPSVVSHHISQLEEKLGVALIYRSTRHLTLTQDGERLLVSAQNMLSAIETGLNEIQKPVAQPSGQLRVTLPSVLSHSILMQGIADFQAKYPKVSIQLVFSDERQNLIQNGYDLAIRMGPRRERAANRQTLFHVQRVLVASHEYLAQYETIKAPKDLETHRWISLTPTRHIKPRLRKAETEIELAPNYHIETNDAIANYHLAEAGAGIAAVPDFLTKDGHLKTLLEDWTLEGLEVYAEWPSNAPRGGLSRLLVSELKSTT